MEYTAVVYLRSSYRDAVDVAIVVEKFEIEPLKKLSIARIEICAA